MKNILVTGAGGFIGSHLVEFLTKKGYNVKAFVIIIQIIVGVGR